MLSSYRLNHVSNEDLQAVTFVPYKHAIFQSQQHHHHSHNHHRRQSCCSILFPMSFERAAPKSILNPRFDSIILEGQYQSSVFPQIRLRYRYALIYVILSTLIWLGYHLSVLKASVARMQLITLYTSYVMVLFTSILFYFLTYTKFYRIHTTFVSIITTAMLCGTSLTVLNFTSIELFSPLGQFSICIEIILLIYTMIPFRLWQNCALAAIYSIIFEIGSLRSDDISPAVNYKIIAMRLMLHLCVHLVGFHILIMNVVRMRGTFIEVGQNLLVKRQLEMEKQLKEKMIHSVMPPRVADMLLKERSSGDQAMFGPTGNVKCLFRPFHMASMENVSILFADIVGFTKMSSTKSAEQLVEILNDLFERFDDLCILNGCEKISTLGDCYYCVSGCPEPRSDHAICCVEMGLGMIAAMRLFDTKRQEGVTMRVGIHTGSVLCGIVGTRRVKFDVWSNDVSLANRMESTGRAGQIHVSEKTYTFLENKYIWEPGEEVEGLKTYYIIRRKSTKSYEHLRPNDLNLSVPIAINGEIQTNNATKLISQSATNLAVTRNDSVSPSALSTGAPSSSSANRCRSTTFNKLTRYLRSSVSSGGAVHSKDQSNQQRPELPQIFISTKSLPESLTSTNPSILNCCPNSLTPNSRQTSDRNATSSDNSKACDSITTPTQNVTAATAAAAAAAAAGIVADNKSIAANLRQWKLPKYLRKFDSRNNNNSVKCDKDCVMNEGSADVNRTTENDQSYQLLPIIIQKTDTATSLNAIDQSTNNGNCVDQDGNVVENTPSCSPSPRSNTNLNTDIIDVRSYISQSRSDITPFYPERADSCKYRSHRYGDVSPMRRPRSKTVALTSQEHLSRKIEHDSRNELRVPNALGRKHSQYCNPTSNNLRLPDMPQNHTSISQERLSTGDLSSWVSNISDDPMSAEQSSAIAIPPNDEIHLDPIRKQSDLQLVRCVKENAKSQQNYLVTPPISKFSLFFLSPLMEQEFRAEAHQLNKRNGPLTIAIPIYNTYFDILIGVVIFLTVSIAMFLLSASEKLKDTPLKWIWFSVFGAVSLIEFSVLVLFTKRLFRNRQKTFYQRKLFGDTELQSTEPKPAADSKEKRNLEKTTSNTITTSSLTIDSITSTSLRAKKYLEDKIIGSISTWYRWHISLGFLMTLPAIITLVHFLISSVTNDGSVFGCHYGFLMIVCIVHFCNFTQLNCWMRSILAVFVAFAFIGGISLSQLEWSSATEANFNVTQWQSNPNSSQPMLILSSDGSANYYRNGSFANRSEDSIDRRKPHCFEKKIDLEIYLDLTLVLVLVWCLNREFEIFYRFAFYSSSIAEKDKIRVQQMKNQADLLLQNIIPKHVADHLKNTAKYSENHHNVAIIFASLINFNELYDESYLGGREYLRVLNELIGDFDELLSRPEFACVEKIKTIGSTFMAASGLDNSLRDQNSNSHINALMEFALAMQEVVAAFNKDLLEFDLILRIGFNVGDVTAGVIGHSRLNYDIWADAVNVSSRMDSTGIAGRIQVSKDSIPFLDSNLYEFEPRGSVFVKGKDNMEVYLVKRKRLEN